MGNQGTNRLVNKYWLNKFQCGNGWQMAGRFSSIGLKDGTIRKEIIEYNRAERLWDDTYETIEEIGEISLPTKSYHMF